MNKIRKQKIGDNEYLSTFCLELTLLVRAGISVENGVFLLAEQETGKKRKRALKNMVEILGEGKSFSDALGEVDLFPRYVYQMVKIGETTGRLEEALRALSHYYEGQMILQSQIRSALWYPTILFLMMVGIIFVLLIQVLPVFQLVYQQMGGEMSGMPDMLLRVGEKLKDWLPQWGGGIAIVFLLIVLAFYCGPIRRGIFCFFGKIFGNVGLFGKIGESRFASAMAMGISSGLYVEDAFHMAMVFREDALWGNKRYENCRKMIEEGVPLWDCFRRNKILGVTYCKILELGIKSGASDTAMAEIARRMQENVSRQIEDKIGCIEPAMVIITCFLVGMLLLIMLLPLIEIMATMG